MHTGAHIRLGAGQYRLDRPLAASSYGVVWRATRQHDGLAVALKLVNHDQMARAHPALRVRWIDSAAKEIAFLGSLAPWDERHIVRLLDSGEHAGLPAMALELLGPDLGRHLAARAGEPPVALDQTLAWLAQANQALAKVHAHGWHYLDLKPANLLLHPIDGGVRLADFGTSRLLAGRPSTSYAGSANWQAPEQFFPNASGHYDTGHRSDYFSLGALFYYLLSGGRALRFCQACGDAWRSHGLHGPALLLRQYQGQPPTLHPDEARLVGEAAGEAALALLTALLAARPQGRPANALQISRMIGAVHAARRPRAQFA